MTSQFTFGKETDLASGTGATESNTPNLAVQDTGNLPETLHQVVVVDPSVADYHSLLEGMDPSIEVIVLEAGATVDSIAQALAGRSGIDSLHIISHGSEGSLHLDGEVLSADTLDENAGALAAIGSALSETGDILLYGCSIDQNGGGEAFLRGLADLTGADVAASNNLTGASARGGDWELETTVGSLESNVFPAASSISQYAGLLATTTYEFESGTGGSGTTTITQLLAGATLRLEFAGVAGVIDTETNLFGGDALANHDGNILVSNFAIAEASSVTVSFTNNASFDLDSIAIGETQGSAETYVLTTNNNDTATTNSLSGADQNLDVSANSNFDGITSFVITSQNGDFSISLDNIIISNVTTNSAPALGGTPADDTATEDVATAIDLSAYNISDADGDTITLTLAVDRGTIASVDGNGLTAGVTVASSGTASMTLQGSVADLNTYLNDTSKITYTTALNDTTTAVLTVTPNDGTVNGTADTVNITITPVNDDPSIIGLVTDIGFTEDTAGNVNLSASTISDVDSASITVTITASEGTFSTPADGNAISVTETRVNDTTITLVGSAANINTYLDTASNIQWTGAANDSGNDTSTFTITANDGDGSGNVALGTVNADITAVNDPPVLGGTPADDTVTEDVATAIDLSAYDVSDAEGSTITLTLAVDRGTIASVDGNGLTAGVTVASSGTASMTLQGSATDLNTYLNDTSKITYTTASHDTTTAVLTVTPNDGTVNGTADTVNITITGVNDAPVLDASQSPVLAGISEDAGDDDGSSADGDDDATNNANNPGTSIATLVVNGSITDADGGAVEAIAVTAVDNTNGVWQYSTNNGTAWNNFSGTTGAAVDLSSISRLLDGTLSGANTQLVRFVPNADYSGSATITFRAWDKSSGSAGATADTSTNGNPTAFSSATDTASITVSAVNDGPAFTSLNGTPGFTENGTAVVLDGDVTVADTELDALNGGNGNYAGASLTIARNGGANAADSFSFDTAGASFTVNAGNLQSGGNTFATFTNAGGTLTINFTSAATTATSALADEVLQRITYENTSADPAANAQLDWSFSDGNSGNTQGTGANPGTETGSVTVTVTGVNDAPTLAATGGNPTFTEGGGAADLFNTVTADTVESGQTFTSLTLTVTNVSDGASEILRIDGSDVALTNSNAVTTATNSLNVGVAVAGSTATVSFTGASLSEAALQTLVDGLTYRNTSDNPTTGANRVVTITGITDSGGTANGGVASAAPNRVSTVTLTPVNDAPLIANLDGDNTGLQPGNSANVDNATNATVSDADSANFNGGFLTITDNGSNNTANGNFAVDGTTVTSGGDGTIAASETIQVGGTTVGTVHGTNNGQGGNTLTINFTTNDASSANIQTLIQNLSWGAAAGTGAQTFTLTLNDNDGTANGGDEDVAANFSMTLGNAPVLDLDGNDSSGSGAGGYAAAFAEGGGTVAIADTDVSLTDADGGATISAITISLTNDQDGAAEGLTVSAAAQNALTGIAGASDITRQDTVTITGATASLAEVQTFLQNVFFDNTSQAPDTTARSITVTVTDNDGLVSSSVTSTVSVSGVNDVPVLASVDATPAFTEDGAAQVLDGNATVLDAELDALNGGNGNYDGATLTLARNGGANAEDVFGNNGLLSALTEAGNLVYNGTTVGTVITNSGGTLLLTFNGNATSALVDNVIQNITYSNASDTPPANVQINYTFNDGNSGAQGSGGSGTDTDDSITVSITAANDAPALGNLDGDAPSGALNAVIAFDAGGDATVTDPDSTDLNGGTLTISRTGALSGDFGLDTGTATSGGDGAIAGGETIAVGGTNIGTVTTDGQGTNDLVITFNTGDATPARVQSLIQALTYQSATAGSHGFTASVNDGDGGTSPNATVTVNVTAPGGGGGGGTPATPPDPDPPINGQNSEAYDDNGNLVGTVTTTETDSEGNTTFQVQQTGETTNRNVTGTLQQQSTTNGNTTTNVTTLSGTISEDRDGDGVADQISFSEQQNTVVTQNSDGTISEQTTVTFSEGGTVVTEIITSAVSTVLTDPVTSTTTTETTLTRSTSGGEVQTGTVNQVTNSDGVTTSYDVVITVTAVEPPTAPAIPPFATVDLAPPNAGGITSEAVENGAQVRAQMPVSIQVTSTTTFNQSRDEYIGMQTQILAGLGVDLVTAAKLAALAANAMFGAGNRNYDVFNLGFTQAVNNDGPLDLPLLSPGGRRTEAEYLELAANYSMFASTDEDEVEAITIDVVTGSVVDVTLTEIVFITAEDAVVRTGSDAEFVTSFAGAQVILTGSGNDIVDAGTGDDTIFGQAGNDLLTGGAGDDVLDGGDNLDAAVYSTTSDAVSLSGTRSSVSAIAGDGTDSLAAVELIVFTGANASGKDRVTVLSQDSSVLTGQYGFNEAAYLSAHADVAMAVAVGSFSSGAEHYALFGLIEGRAADLIFDEEFYLADNADVAAAVAAGGFVSASEHYLLHGFMENRTVNPLFDPDYYLAQNADVANAVAVGDIISAYQHYLVFGDSEGRAASAFFDTATYRAEQGLDAYVSALEHFLLIGLPQGITAPTHADF